MTRDTVPIAVKFSSVGRRKLSMSQLLSAGDPSQAQQPPSPQHTSSFYIGLAEGGNNNNKVRLLNIIKAENVLT